MIRYRVGDLITPLRNFANGSGFVVGDKVEIMTIKRIKGGDSIHGKIRKLSDVATRRYSKVGATWHINANNVRPFNDPNDIDYYTQ